MRVFTSNPTLVKVSFTADWSLSKRQAEFLSKKLTGCLELTGWQESIIFKMLTATTLAEREDPYEVFSPSDRVAVMEVVTALNDLRFGERKLIYIANLNRGWDLLLQLTANIPESVQLAKIDKISQAWKG